MRLIWTYSKHFKKGGTNNRVGHDYIQWLYRKSIKSAPASYYKIIYTDEESVALFKDLVDEVIIREPKEFIFLDDLKFDIADQLSGEFILIDGDLFLDGTLTIPSCDMGFEYKGKAGKTVRSWKEVLIKEGIEQYIPIWGTPNYMYYNLGLMYFNNEQAKKELIEVYRMTQNFYINYIEPKYKFNQQNKMFAACSAQMLIQQFNLNSDYNIGEFNLLNSSNYEHINNLNKFKYISEFTKKLI